MLFENVVKQDLQYINGNQYTFITKLLMGYLKNQNLVIDLPLTKADSITYLAKVSGHEELLPLIETATMSQDFKERNKAQKELVQKMAPCRKWLKENIFEIASKAKKPKVSKNVYGDYVIEYKPFENDDEYPYMKFIDDVQNKVIKIISFHNNEMSFKKKSFNDTNSWKFGNRDLRNKIREKMGKK